MKTRNTSHKIVHSNMRCHLCDRSTVTSFPAFETFHRVTSDCKPWKPGGTLGVCQTCGGVQKIIDNLWHEEITDIYETYEIYHQSAGAEQKVFEDSGRAVSRSARLLDRVNNFTHLSPSGRLLDIGCGNGALFRAFHARFPDWSLVGTELHNKYRQCIESLKGVDALYTCSPSHIPGTFGIITMIHVLEHIAYPKDFLFSLRDSLHADGLLIIEVPDYTQNPFDLLIADHCIHFSAATIASFIENAGYEIINIATNWVSKELTLLARKSEQPRRPQYQNSGNDSSETVKKSLEWLTSVRKIAQKDAIQHQFGVFGTSIAATWLWRELKGAVHFFVDEDPHRIGKTYMGQPVFHPKDIPTESHVFMALPHQMAKQIMQRTRASNVNFTLPPELPAQLMKKAIFLDRDGVLIEDVDLLTDWEDIRILNRVPLALHKLKSAGFHLIIISNQTVVARGLATEQDVHEINTRVETYVEQAGGPRFDGSYFCPHHPKATLTAYRRICECRKPRAGLLRRAAREHNIDLNASFMIGDRITDIIAGVTAGCRTILVQTGRHLADPIETVDFLDKSIAPDYTCLTLDAAADWVLGGKS